MMNALESTSTRPYLIRALYEWCTDNGFTPYIAVLADEMVQVPREYVQNGEIVLNISFDATSGLKLGNEFIEFKARFAGTAREIMVPIDRVQAIYARETGQGMAFPIAVPNVSASADSIADQPTAATENVPVADTKSTIQLVSTTEHSDGDEPPPESTPPKKRERPPTLKVVK